MSASPAHRPPTHATPRRRSSGLPAALAIGVQACLWLLLVLLPLRGLAALQMVTPGAPQGAAAPACHETVIAATPADALQAEAESLTTQGPVSPSCACCLFCAPALPAAAAAFADLAPGAGTVPQAELSAMPEGVRDTLFRPPRG